MFDLDNNKNIDIIRNDYDFQILLKKALQLNLNDILIILEKKGVQIDNTFKDLYNYYINCSKDKIIEKKLLK